MAYTEFIESFGLQHHWHMNGNYNDIGNSLENRPCGVNQQGTINFVANPLCQDTAQSMRLQAASRTECLDASDINSANNVKRSVGGWYKIKEITKPSTNVFKEGGGSNNMLIAVGFGNNILFQIVDALDFDIQVLGNRTLKADRAYHLFMRFEGDGHGNLFEAYIDGVKLTEKLPANGVPDFTHLTQHGGDVNWGEADTSINVGGESNNFKLGDIVHYAQWISESSRSWTDAEVYSLFEQGVLPVHTVTNQLEMDALANTHFIDEGCCIRIDVPLDIVLTMTNITFDEFSTIHVQFTGDGKCTINSAGTTNLTKTSTLGLGSIVIVPAAPTWFGAVGITNAYQNGQLINASWGIAVGTGAINYDIYITDVLGNMFTPSALYATLADNAISITTEADGITDLRDVTYYIGVRARDTHGNETDNTNTLSVTYINTQNVLTDEQHNQLMNVLATKIDVIVASQI